MTLEKWLECENFPRRQSRFEHGAQLAPKRTLALSRSFSGL
jgi:hypothetical protein